ncbi:MAG: DUF1489 family protein [Pseudomonadota bacterium]
MPLHLIKLCVGIEDVAHLAAIHKKRLASQRKAGIKRPVLRHLTRSTPRRSQEILDGGSLYWVIKGVVRVRQRILAIRPATRDGEPACELRLDRRHVRVVPRSMRAFQGWRYLEAEDAPPDLAALGRGAAEMPADMAEELGVLGLL